MNIIAVCVILCVGAACLAALVALLIQGMRAYIAPLLLALGTLCAAALLWLWATGIISLVLSSPRNGERVFLVGLLFGAIASLSLAAILWTPNPPRNK